MHDTAYESAREFVDKYIADESSILDVGSKDINGSMRPLFGKCSYTGMDLEGGENVDIVGSSHDMPFDDYSFDAVVSSSCFEHDVCFWETFREMCRVVKEDGYIYISAPSTGRYHPYPYDCWRFYSDSGKALEYWINNFTDFRIILVDSKITQSGEWRDNTMIFQKIKN